MKKMTIRTRLTLVVGGMLLAGGLLLLGITYVLVFQQLGDKLFITKSDQIGTLPPDLPGGVAANIRGEFRGDASRAVLTQGSIALAVVVVIGLAFSWLIAGRLLQPLHRVTETARRIAGAPDRGLHERIALEGPYDEVKELADTFDLMIARLDKSFDVQRRFIVNASHELRTPLTLNRTLLEVSTEHPDAAPELRQLGRTLLAVNDRHERLIDGLLLLARSERAVGDRSYVDLADVVTHVAALQQGEAERLAAPQQDEAAKAAAPQQDEPEKMAALRRGGPVNAAAPQPDETANAIGPYRGEAANVAALGRGEAVKVTAVADEAPTSGNAVLLERLVHNLVENGVRYNVPSGGRVRVESGTRPDGVYVTVSNTGPVVPRYEIPNLFEPFRRLGPERSAGPGAGLGLSIVRAVAAAHGGRVFADPRDGGGLTVTVILPTAASSEYPT